MKEIAIDVSDVKITYKLLKELFHTEKICCAGMRRTRKNLRQ